MSWAWSGSLSSNWNRLISFLPSFTRRTTIMVKFFPSCSILYAYTLVYAYLYWPTASEITFCGCPWPSCGVVRSPYGGFYFVKHQPIRRVEIVASEVRLKMLTSVSYVMAIYSWALWWRFGVPSLSDLQHVRKRRCVSGVHIAPHVPCSLWISLHQDQTGPVKCHSPWNLSMPMQIWK